MKQRQGDLDEKQFAQMLQDYLKAMGGAEEPKQKRERKRENQVLYQYAYILADFLRICCPKHLLQQIFRSKRGMNYLKPHIKFFFAVFFVAVF